MLICVGVFETWSSPRITCVIPSMHVVDRRDEVVGRPAVGADDHEVGRAARSRTRSGRAPRRPTTTVPSSGCGSGSRPRPRRPCLRRAAAARARAPCRPCRAGRSPSPSQSIPSQRSDSWICSTASATSRLVSVFSIRSRHSPPCWRAKSQLKRNVRTPPMWRKPVGLGAMRTRTVIALYRRGAVEFGAHVSSSGRHRHRDRPHRGDRRRLRAGVHAEPAHVAADRATSRRRSSASRRGAPRRASAASSATRSISATSPRRTTRSTRSRSQTMRSDGRRRLRDRGRRRSSSTSARTSAPASRSGSSGVSRRSRRSSSAARATRGC